MKKTIKGFIALGLLLAVAIGGIWGHQQIRMFVALWANGPAALIAEFREQDRSPFRLMGQQQVEDIFREHLRYNQEVATGLARHLLEVCQKHELRPALVLALIRAESSFKANAVSNRGAVGLMQLMPDTARFIADRWGIRYQGDQELFDPYKNIDLGVTYLAYLRDKYGGSLHHMLAAYNIGPAKVDRLMAENRFRVNKTRPYIDSIRDGLQFFRDWGRDSEAPTYDLFEAMEADTRLKDVREPNV